MLNEGDLCPTDDCGSPEFISIPIGPQVKRLWKAVKAALLLVHVISDEKTWKSLGEHLRRPAFHGSISDVYDGENYRAYSTNNQSEHSHLSLLVNTDGVAVFRLSTVSMWPVWLMINELPMNCRYANNY